MDNSHSPMPYRVFIAYASRNDKDREDLDTRLATLKSTGWIDVWYDHRILPGFDYQEEINDNLDKADIIILLISAYFLASDACRGEMERSLARHKQTAIVVPVILEECDWEGEEIGRIEVLPEKSRPVSSYSKRSNAFASIAKGIRRLISEGAEFLLEHRVVDELRALQIHLMDHYSVRDYIDLRLVKQERLDSAGENSIRLGDGTAVWRSALIDNGRHLIEAEGGAGKTTFLRRLIWQAAAQHTPRAPVLWYLYIARPVNNPQTAGWNLLCEYILNARSRLSQDKTPALGALASDPEKLITILIRLADTDRLMVCVDGYDQVESSESLTDFLESTAFSKHAIVCTRPLQSDLSFHRELFEAYTRWAIDPVSLRQAEHFLGARWRDPSMDVLRKSLPGRRLLRRPLFLEVIKQIDGRGHGWTPGDLMLRYWEGSISQENRARPAPAIDRESARRLMSALEAGAYHLAIEGQIERFPSDDPRNTHVTSMVKMLENIPGNLDVIRIGTYEGQFKHQAFQEYFTARALARNVELASEVSAHLNTHPTFWQAVLGYLPAALRHTGNSSSAMSYIWRMVGRLVGGGQPLASWILVQAAERDGIHLGDGEGWLYVVFQLIRYRRDIEKHFPGDAKRWHYDPLPLAVSAIDQFSPDQHELLGSGIKERLSKLDALDVECLGIYEVVTAWSDWNGRIDDLDRHRANFVLGAAEGQERIGMALRHYLEEALRPEKMSRKFLGDWNRRGTNLPSPGPAAFGDWLRDHLADIPGSINEKGTVRRAFDRFEDEAFDQTMIPREPKFWGWIAYSLINDLAMGLVPSFDVSLSVFDAELHEQLPVVISERYEELKDFVVRGLSGVDINGFTAASVIAGEMRSLAQTTRSDPEFIVKMTTSLRAAFSHFRSATDVELAYIAYHELTRLEDDREWLVGIRDHILRYFSEEIRWLDPYVPGDQMQFVERRSKDPRYAKKRWLYFFITPFLDIESGRLAKLLEYIDTLELNDWEAEGRNWTKLVVANLQGLRERNFTD